MYSHCRYANSNRFSVGKLLLDTKHLASIKMLTDLAYLAYLIIYKKLECINFNACSSLHNGPNLSHYLVMIQIENKTESCKPQEGILVKCQLPTHHQYELPSEHIDWVLGPIKKWWDQAPVQLGPLISKQKYMWMKKSNSYHFISGTNREPGLIIRGVVLWGSLPC